MASPFLVFIFMIAYALGCVATNTITSTTPLSGTQKLVSKGNKFELGFYSPTRGGDTSSNRNYYIAIWFGNIPEVTAVWIANTEDPLSDPSTASLSISTDGNLILFDKTRKRQVWSTNASISSNSTVAAILDSGSLVLTDAFDSSKVFWCSIDHPTNTWLAGGKLGLNKITGVSQRLTAWRSNDDPSPGLFSLVLDPKGTTEYLMQWNKSVSYWTSGPWNGEVFSLVPEMRSDYAGGFKFVDNANESYFTYGLPDDSIVSRVIMDTDGQFKHLMWLNASQKWILFWSQPRTQCEVYAVCGPYGSCKLDVLPFCSCIKGFIVKDQSDWDLRVYSGGCKRGAPLHCQTNLSSEKSETDKFHSMVNVRLPDHAQTANAGSPENCQVACLNSCSCNAYTYNNSGCFVWHGDLVGLQEQYGGDRAGTIFLRLAVSELPGATKRRTAPIGVVTGGVVAVLAILAIILFILIQRYLGDSALQVFNNTGDRLTTYRYSDLQHATNNFSVKLGGGAFGSVFKGQLPVSSTPIAVKRLDGLQQGDKQFRTEVLTVGMINHVNLVRLLGFCAEKSSRFLVYEFMEGGSLDRHLCGKDGSTILDWKTRYNIALGIARGLAYLHEQCRECIIHCDLKPENILLDANFQAKVADFGLAKLLGRDFSCVLTTMRGTMGYLAPEWFSGLPITSKIDVYSFGIMLFELISGRRNTTSSESEIGPYFPCWAAIQVIDGNESFILDNRLGGVADMEELVRASRLACWCVQYEEHRPSMALVVKMMEGNLGVDVPPFPGPLRCLLDNKASSLTDTNLKDLGSSTR
jgi:hypothetical protein